MRQTFIRSAARSGPRSTGRAGRHLAAGFLGLLLPALGAGPALPGVAAQPDKAATDEVPRLLARLGSEQFAEREAASRRLEAIGEPAWSALDEAATTSEDPEIRRRAEGVLRAIGARRFAGAGQVRRFAWQDTVQDIPAHLYHTAFAPDGRSYLAGGDIGPLRLWDVATGRQVQEFKGHNGWTCQAVFTPDGKQVLSGGTQDRLLRLWDVGTGREVRTFAGHTGEVTGVAVSPDGRFALSGSSDRTLRLWDLAGGKEIRRLEGHADRCEGVFSPDGSQVLSFSTDRTLRLWDPAGGKLLRTLTGHTGPVDGAFFLPGGGQAVSFARDRSVRVWDLAAGKEVRRHDAGEVPCAVRWLALTPDGRYFLTNHQDFTIRLRDLATGREVHRLTLPPPATPQGLSVSPDGRHAACGSWRGFVYLFRLRE